MNGNRCTTARRSSARFVSSSGGTSTTVDPNMKKPYADEFDVSVEQQFWGESSVRVAYVRKNTQNEITTIDLVARRPLHRARRDDHACRIRDFVNGVTRHRQTSTCWISTRRRRRRTRSPTCRTAATSTTRCSSRSTSGSAAGCSSRAATTTSGGTSCGRRRLGASTTTATRWHPSGSPLNSDPITIGFFQNAVPDGQQPAEEHELAGPRDGALRVQVRHRRGGQPARAERIQLLAVSSARRCRNAGTVRFFSENIENNRSETVPILDLRADKAFRIGRYRFTGMARRLFNADELERRDELHAGQRRGVQPDHRDARSAHAPVRRPVRLLSR